MRIGIIGPTGAGKSSLAKKLATHFHATYVEESVEKNEYLPYFYQDRDTFALLTQNAFYGSLFLSLWKTRDVKNLICDSTLFNNLVHTEILRLDGILSAAEVAVTLSVAEQHLKRIPDFDLHIVLVRTPEQLRERLEKYGRPYEKKETEFFHQQNQVYYDTVRRIFQNYKIAPQHILWLPVNDLDDPKEFAHIVELVETALKAL
ncbi:MAG: deoxynucleoside kinase [Firmicutes bacterium]|nr:deoxynucleoside kinase [Bacillota bacterium]